MFLLRLWLSFSHDNDKNTPVAEIFDLVFCASRQKWASAANEVRERSTWSRFANIQVTGYRTARRDRRCGSLASQRATNKTRMAQATAAPRGALSPPETPVYFHTVWPVANTSTRSQCPLNDSGATFSIDTNDWRFSNWEGSREKTNNWNFWKARCGMADDSVQGTNGIAEKKCEDCKTPKRSSGKDKALWTSKLKWKVTPNSDFATVWDTNQTDTSRVNSDDILITE